MEVGAGADWSLAMAFRDTKGVAQATGATVVVLRRSPGAGKPETVRMGVQIGTKTDSSSVATITVWEKLFGKAMNKGLLACDGSGPDTASGNANTAAALFLKKGLMWEVHISEREGLDGSVSVPVRHSYVILRKNKVS